MVDSIPSDAGWQFEPKWDGFRCLAFRDGDEVALRSRSGQPFERYFPEIVTRLRTLDATRFVLDGELVVPSGDALSFDDLLQRIHPAASRVARLARETPATFLVFDLLVDDDGGSLLDAPLHQRRRRLEAFAARYVPAGDSRLRLSPATHERATVDAWYARVGGALDGVVAKRVDAPYRPGARDAVVKVKAIRQRRLRRRRIPARDGRRRDRVAAARLVRCRGPARLRRLHLGLRCRREARAPRASTAAARDLIVRWPRARRPEPLESRQVDRMAAATAGTRAGSRLRSGDSGPLSARDAPFALASGQAASGVHNGSTRAERQDARGLRLTRALEAGLPWEWQTVWDEDERSSVATG